MSFQLEHILAPTTVLSLTTDSRARTHAHGLFFVSVCLFVRQRVLCSWGVDHEQNLVGTFLCEFAHWGPYIGVAHSS